MGQIRDFVIQPGVVRDNTELSAKPRWVDSDRIRFVNGLPQKIGGWVKRVATTFTGKCRGMLGWSDASDVPRLALGTHLKLLVLEGASFFNITPIRETAALTNPFTTVSGSDIVTVVDSTHGAIIGDTVEYSGASAVGGITIDGEYQIIGVTDADTYTIRHGADATSSATGGGSVTAKYEINVGRIDTALGGGWGVGTYGTGTYGTSRPSTLRLPARTWALDQWGEYLVACHRNGRIYEWQLNIGTRAQLIVNAPINNTGIWVTEEQHLVAYGAGGNRMRVEWCDQSDNTVWTPSDQNTAGGRTLVGGSKIFEGLRTRGGNLLLTDASVWQMIFVGGPGTFGFQQVAAGAAGIISPRAACDVDGVVYWMGLNDFYYFDGVVRRIRNSKEVRRFVFDNLTPLQTTKIWVHCNTLFSEIIWFYPTAQEITRYVKVNYDEWSWDVGTLERLAGIDKGVFTRPIMADGSSFLFDHEVGNDDDGAAMNEFLLSSPKDIAQGDRMMEILSIYPDFKDLTGEIDLALLTRDYPQDVEERVELGPVMPGTTQLDARAAGRQVALEISSKDVGSFWRYGLIRAEVEEGGQR